MGFEYALVHLKYTIPPALVLTLLYRPLFTKLDAYKILFLITVAVVSTIPWDSYLIRNAIWSYPSHVIIGPKVLDIPLEEVFFFMIQTYNTSLLYLVLTKPTFHSVYLRVERSDAHPLGAVNPRWRHYKMFGQMVFGVGIVAGWRMVKNNGHGTYTGLILVWAAPFLLLLWSLAYQFIIGLPLSNTVLPIIIPTVYLWGVDTLALQRGTWVVTAGTKHGIHLWPGLDVEEALFFLLTNTLIVFGQLAFDNALAVLYTFPDLYPNPPALPSPSQLVQALLVPASRYNKSRVVGLQDAVTRLKKKSRSFYLASSTFQGQIRTDLLLLYSFCRVADDLVDNATSASDASEWIAKLQRFLGIAYADGEFRSRDLYNMLRNGFPKETHSALMQLPARKLSRQHLEDLLKGFETDVKFSKEKESPIQTSADLELYARRVAGTVAQMCLELIFNAYQSSMSGKDKDKILAAGSRMGIALQYVNIARDIKVDAKLGRVYLPTTWLDEADLTYKSVLEHPWGPEVETVRSRLLDEAFKLYEGAREAIEELPVEASGPMRVSVQSYMEIGRVLRQDGYVVKAGRATVPKWRRIMVARAALAGRV
ncbi:Lycopene beta-cyclase [Pleomassaria siparia CBS 279.74]|uniref:Bifunctional lycopene cyclase/phytoene synthase n=1 Tax=Pleomassaria siparia CBS 279.74 TaxID=1314801 RepID=A0A6G1JUP0_9PLEO|nr:Lycopene beta-cyclase [Pleomassaria siparia CBS 279.74]